MPENKNATTRYKILDELLSNRYHDRTLDDLTDDVNSRLEELGMKSVPRRCIEKDIHYLEYDGQYMVDIERYNVPYYNAERDKTVTRMCLRYRDSSFSIYKKEMSDDEKYLLSQALELLGQFDGLPNLEALQQLQKGLDTKEYKQIVSFTKNPLGESSVFGELFTCISQKQVVRLHYYKFGDESVDLTVDLHPYLLKEYNRRWYLFAAAVDNGKLLCFALDRVNRVEPLTSVKYIDYDGDINEWFEDIIGVTRYEGKPVEHIVFWVSDRSNSYVSTKPLHESQKMYKGAKDADMRNKYHTFEGGTFFSIDCIENYELIRELMSFGAELVVLEPSVIREVIRNKVCAMYAEYK